MQGTPLFQNVLQALDSLFCLVAPLTFENPVWLLHKDVGSGSPHHDQNHHQQHAAYPNARYVDPVVNFKE